ncbi:MAG: transcriptional regulator [Flavobacteriaceae bacterium]|nr:transcriptional regulator [Flavobacteriaceae bacterium]|tara:strand:- start:418 stop:870 length:453 start_codon:yes stop_codon:yes gene_type:complete
MKLDGIDKKILRELIADSRKPILEISRNIGISGAAIHQRIKKLNENKLISGQHLKVNPKILGYTTLAFIGIYFDKAERNSEAIKKMKDIPEILECHYTTGNWSVLIKVICKNNEDLMNLLNKQIQSIDGVARTETFISLEQQIERQISIN